ncbi:MAG: tRNA uridine-5-carboxymethylaminomethyl(34) synthesis GTPase MnmE [Pseudohongiellaceae bacterium]
MNPVRTDTDTICAMATPPGRSGVGIIRVSGPRCRELAEAILGHLPKARNAGLCRFHDRSGQVIDQGIALFFPAPHSFTGEDVLELQGHGGLYLLNALLAELAGLGARLARPGEFSERAFMNDKLDLTQAEAIADLIDASSEQAARSAIRTLQGEFSRLIHQLAESITELRVYVEASIDFSDEEIDFLSEGGVAYRLDNLLEQLDAVLEQARQGSILKEGMSVVIAGRPNAGKSSLLNALAGRDTAIVTDIAGTTRDTLRENIHIDGMPLHITDTAGLRDSEDRIEQEGIRRARSAMEQADRLLLVIDAHAERTMTTSDARSLDAYLEGLRLPAALRQRLTLVLNKCDLAGLSPGLQAADAGHPAVIRLSALTSDGVDLLRTHLKDCMGFDATEEGGFIARTRHLDALKRAQSDLRHASEQLQHQAGELVAEDLRHAHRHLGEITGEFTTDDLLGRIFSSFCIGK